MARGKRKQSSVTEHNTAFVYRIYPDGNQIAGIRRTFGCCRKIWNLMLEAKNSHYAATGENLTVTPAQFKNQYPYLKDVDSMALCNVQMNLQQAFAAFFKSCSKKSGKKAGRPKFKSKRRSRKSYTTNFINGNIEILENGIKLPKLGIVPAVIHRKAPPEYKLKSVTVIENPDGTFEVSVLYAYTHNFSRRMKKHIGLDYKSDGLYVDSSGRCACMPHFFRKGQKKLAKAQQKLSRKIGARKGETPSKNYLKQKKKVAKLHRHVANQRKDFLHKESTAITKQYDLVSVEDLSLSGISRGLHLGKSTMDNGYGMFVNMLEYKQKREGHFFQKVGRFFPSSQKCSVCGNLNPQMKNLSIRTLHCTHCGTVIDRDLNAARCIDAEGLRLFMSP